MYSSRRLSAVSLVLTFALAMPSIARADITPEPAPVLLEAADAANQPAPLLAASDASPVAVAIETPHLAASATPDVQHQIDSLSAQIESLKLAIDQLRSASGTRASETEARLQPGASFVAGSKRQKPAADVATQNIYEQNNALFNHGLTLTPSFSQVYSDSRFFTLNGFLALGAIFLGNINVSTQKSYVSIFGLGATYGLTPRLELSANVPLYSRDTTFASVGANGASSLPSQTNSRATNLGDVSAGLFYQLAAETEKRPNIIAHVQATFPTGVSPYGIKLATDRSNTNLQYPSHLPTGQGVYQIDTGISFVKTADPAIFIGGADYYHNFVNHFGDISTDPRTTLPGDAVPGDSFSYNIGTAFALNEKTSMSFVYQDTRSTETKIRTGHAPYQSVIGSGTNAALLNIGVNFALSGRRSVSTQLGFGLSSDAPNYQLSVRLPTRF